MRKFVSSFLALAAGVAARAQPADAPLLPLNDLKPGQHGEGYPVGSNDGWQHDRWLGA